MRALGSEYLRSCFFTYYDVFFRIEKGTIFIIIRLIQTDQRTALSIVLSRLYFIKPFSSSSSSDEDFENKENLAAKSKHTDWFDNHETDSETSLDEKNVWVKINASNSSAQKLPKIDKSSQKVAKMAINGTSFKDPTMTSSSSDENTSDDEVKENAAKLDLSQGKKKIVNLFCLLI